MTKCTFEKVILIKGIHYWLYWFLLGILGFILGEFLFQYYNEEYLLVSRILASFAVFAIPSFNIWLFYSFRKTILSLSFLLWDGEDGAKEWLTEKEQHIFTLHTLQAKIITATIIIFGLLTIIFLGIPFKSTAVSVIGFLAFAAILWFSGQTLYISIALLATLREITQRSVRVPFFLTQHPAISDLQNFYSLAALGIVVLYINLVVAIWQGPYGLHMMMMAWLTLLALYPISMLSWSFIQNHFLLRTIKQSHLEIISQEVQIILSKVKKNHSKDNLERLEKAMNIQNTIQSIKEWPIEIGGVITFSITLLTALTQITLSILQMLNP